MPALLVLVALVFLPARPAAAQELIPRVDAYVSRYHQFGLFNGAILVADGNSVVYEKGFGFADAAWDIPNAPDTRFLLGSLTKQFTAVLVLQLMETDSIDLSAPITRYLPAYPADPGDRISVEQLLRHTSGIPEYWPIGEFHERARAGAEPVELVPLFAKLPLDFEPGSDFRYSNSGYFLLGLIIEQVTGISYPENLRRRILEPLGLDESGYQDGTQVIERMAEGYQRIAGEMRPAPYMPPAAGFSAAMMYSSVGDMLRWSEALHAAEPFRDPGTLDRMLRPGPGDYGLGLEVRERELGGERVLVTSHEGGVNGFGTMFHYLPRSGRMVIAADNTQRSMVALTEGVLRMLHGEAPDPPRQPIADVLRTSIREDGIDAALSLYAELSASDPGGYDFREFQLNRLGYELLAAGDGQAAIAVFRLNAETFPDSFNTWDSLAEAYLLSGNREQAIDNYRRSVRLNPDNQNGRDALRRLGADP